MFRDRLLKEILSTPSAPYREGQMVSLISGVLKEGGVPFFFDPCGNIVVGVSSDSQYRALLSKKSSEPVRIFMAHLDHPGFHGVKWQTPRKLAVRWFGGSPTRHLNGSKVWLSSGAGPVETGVLQNVVFKKKTKRIHNPSIESGVVVFKSNQEIKAADFFGGFAFRKPVWQKGPLVYTKAADDLVGCFTIVSTALDLWKKKSSNRPPFLGVLTRAEEVGLIGALGHFQLGWLQTAKREFVIVSIETSRALPGAAIGKGPVVRLGDRSTVFDPRALQVFRQVAKKVLPGTHQVKLMDGGTCEASGAMAYGFACVGISVPLGNYHNQSIEGGPDSRGLSGPAPEFVHRMDIQGVLKLCHGLLMPDLPWVNPWETMRQDFDGFYKKVQKLMRAYQRW
ncbi:hypothetical protein WDW86_09265 [Bdellovibrionota bacterium FG-2]